MKRISDYTLISDMDGTLLGPDGFVPRRNVEAIGRFVTNGGKFGIATGRSRGLMRDRVEGLPINAPCVLYNGGALYDYADDRMLMEIFLPDAAREYIVEITEEMPGIGALIISGDSYYQIKVERDFAEFYGSRDARHFHPDTVGGVTGEWYKLLFQTPEERFEEFLRYVNGKRYAGVRFVATSRTLIEMLPAQSNKGFALEKLIEMGLVERENLVAVGDFYNDLEMIELAGIGATLCSSPPDIRERADLVVGDCGGGAVADVIEHLERLCGA